MHPALSVIIFTSVSGAGYGLLVLMALSTATGLVPAGSALAPTGTALALSLITVGLLTSTAHLGHPERAWRALSQWRSSWLSREGVFAVATYPAAALYFLGLFPWLVPGLVWPGWGLIAAALSLLTIYATGKIYASLKTIRQWHNGQVVPGYLLIGLLGGSLLLTFLSTLFGLFRMEFATTSLILAVLVGLLKMSYWRAISDESSASTSRTATGLGRDGERVRLLDSPNTSENFVMREMGYRIARKHAGKLRHVATTTLFGLPALASLCVMMVENPLALALIALTGVLSAGLGTLIERWLFFAEARHVVTLYYGAETA